MEATTAEVLQNRLTEHGLVRVLARQDVDPTIVKLVPLEKAARQIQQGFAPPRRVVVKRYKKVRAAKKAKKSAPRPKSAVKKASGPPPAAAQPNYWLRVKRELHILLCTSEKKYAAIRRQIGKQGTATQLFLATSIAAAIAPFVGASATLIGPLVTLGLISLVRVGTNAWCAGHIE